MVSYVYVIKVSVVDMFHLFEDSLAESMAKDYVLLSSNYKFDLSSVSPNKIVIYKLLLYSLSQIGTSSKPKKCLNSCPEIAIISVRLSTVLNLSYYISDCIEYSD